MTDPGYKLLVYDERTVLVRLWTSGEVEVASRPNRWSMWGRPTLVREERAMERVA